MVLIIFRSRLTESTKTGQLREEYLKRAERMLALARSFDGFVSFKSFTSEDGERLSITEFENEESALAWKAHPEHLEAQQAGRASYYQKYQVQVCKESRSYTFRKG